MYASGKITTTNNILLGPADEYIPSPDIHDSDFNSLNITVSKTTGLKGADAPTIQYIRDGNPFDLHGDRVRLISSGIGTIVGQGTTNETLGTVITEFDISTPNVGEFGRENGYLKFEVGIPAASTLDLDKAYGYQIVAQEFITTPVGYSTFVGIQTGHWKTAAGIVTDVTSTVAAGVAQTDYHVTLADKEQFPAISVGDVVKLVNHQVSPSLSSVELTVAEKLNVDVATKRLRLTSPQVYNPSTGAYVSGWNLSGDATVTNCINGRATADDYISIRDRFIIAKGRVGVTN